jgi:formate/nitrite transporter FocA (FNT family)
MSAMPDPSDIYDRAEEEGRRRLAMSFVEATTTAFIAGVTIVFGIVALGVVEGLAKPELSSGLARLFGASGFAIGMVFLIVGRTELFSENFFGPVTEAIQRGGRRVWGSLLELWAVTLAFNILGGAVLVAVLTVDGALPAGAAEALTSAAMELTAKPWPATVARAVMAGALLTLLSYLLEAVDTVTSRILVTYFTGFILALGPFDHVVVSALHLLFGIWLGGPVGYDDLFTNMGLATAGNVVGGLFLMTFTHAEQVKGTRAGD